MQTSHPTQDFMFSIGQIQRKATFMGLIGLTGPVFGLSWELGLRC